jgi:hypothetical protein
VIFSFDSYGAAEAICACLAYLIGMTRRKCDRPEKLVKYSSERVHVHTAR